MRNATHSDVIQTILRAAFHIAGVIANPLYARDDFTNDGKIDLVGKPPALGDYLLVAVEIIRDGNGRYNITSFYPVSERKIANRRASGHLRRVLPM